MIDGQDKLRIVLQDDLSHPDDFRRRIVIELIQELELLDEVLVDLISDRLEVHFLRGEVCQVS